MRCEEVQEALPAYMREGGVSLAMRHHLTTCRACSVELARYEVLAQGLRDLQSTTVPVPSDLMRLLLAIPAGESRLRVARSHVVRNRKAYLGGLVVAAAGAAGVAILKSRTGRVAAA